MNLNKFKKLKGDASSRVFYRDIKNKSIIVFSKKEKKKNLLIYDAINKLLLKNKINVPYLISEKYKNNIIKIQDLGGTSALHKFKNFNIKNYKNLFKILLKLKKIKSKNIKTFLNTNYEIPTYSNNLLFNESKLFIEWYLPTKIKKNRRKISLKLSNIFKKLINNIKLKKKILVHRDFHISNIMIFKNKFYLIDSQDAVYGNIAYDLASLIDDVRLKVDLKNREKIYNNFVPKIKNINKSKFRNDFEILSILRNFKIIGIFTRLLKRDQKKSYIKMIPYAWKMIDERRKKSEKFIELNYFLDRYFPKEIRDRK